MLLQHQSQSKKMRIWGDDWKILRVHGVLERYRSQPRQNPGHNGDGTTKEHKRSGMPQWQDGCAEKVRFEGDRQVSTFLSPAEEIFRVDGQMPISF